MLFYSEPLQHPGSHWIEWKLSLTSKKPEDHLQPERLCDEKHQISVTKY